MSRESLKRIFIVEEHIRLKIQGDNARVRLRANMEEAGFCPVSDSVSKMMKAGVVFDTYQNMIEIGTRQSLWLVPLVEGALREIMLLQPETKMIYIIPTTGVYPFKLTLNNPCPECGTRSRMCYKCPGCGHPIEENLNPLRDCLPNNIPVRVID